MNQQVNCVNRNAKNANKSKKSAGLELSHSVTGDVLSPANVNM